MKNYMIIGNGGYAKVIADTIKELKGTVVHVYSNDTEYNPSAHPSAEVVIAIGDNAARKKIAEKVKHNCAILVHPSAIIGSNVTIGKGTVILANTVIQCNATIGSHVMIQSNVTIDHDAVIEDFAFIYPGTYIGGGAKISHQKCISPNTVVSRLQTI